MGEDHRRLPDHPRVEWLPPRAPGSQPPPRFDPDLPDPPPPPPRRPSSYYPGPLPPGPPRPPRNDRAVLSLILGIGGLVAFFGAQFGLFFVFNLPPAIAAWVIGARAKERVDRGETTEGGSAAKAGIVLGIVGTVLGILAVVGWALALALSEDARRELPGMLGT